MSNLSLSEKLNRVRALSFDLDDTLWPLMPPILAAEKALKGWLSKHTPSVVEYYQPANLEIFRAELSSEFPGRRADVSWFRKRLLHRVFLEAGLPAEQVEPLVDEAFAVFIKERCAVTLYNDSEAALHALSRDYRLVAITNGNSDVFSTPVGTLFEFALSPVQQELAGLAKPNREIFRRAAERLGVNASEMLHIGDCPNADVAGAKAAGWLTALMWRSKGDLPNEHGADFVVRSMTDLQKLLQR